MLEQLITFAGECVVSLGAIVVASLHYANRIHARMMAPPPRTAEEEAMLVQTEAQVARLAADQAAQLKAAEPKPDPALAVLYAERDWVSMRASSEQNHSARTVLYNRMAAISADIIALTST